MWSDIAFGAVLASRGAKRIRPEEQGYDDDFVVDDEEEPDWRQALKSITKYDPSKYGSTAKSGCVHTNELLLTLLHHYAQLCIKSDNV